tara:strand:- start:226 stop:3321 length:3096 start_codon:yes stop_codon:yes gene_type:complete
MKKTLLYSLIIFLSLHLNSSADLVGYWKLDGDFTDSSGNGNDGTLFGGATYSDSVPDTLGGGQSVEFDGTPGTYGSINDGTGGLAITETPSYTISMWVKGDGTIDNVDDRIFSEATSTNNNPLFNMGTRNNGADGVADVYVRNGQAYGHEFSNGQPFDGTWRHIAWVDNDGLLDLYIDGEFDRQFDYSIVPSFTPDTTTIGGILRATDCCNFTGNIDELAIWDEALSEDVIASLADGSFSPGGPQEDDDDDGLPDSYEERLVDNLDDLNGNGAGPGPGSGTGDFDGDGLTDLDEFEETKTDPTKKDTDGDGLNDNVETDTGTYVSASNTGTNPKEADTDNDGLLDGVETNTGKLVDEEDTGTDPNNSDSDGDGYSDGGEIVGGTDPNDENSKGALPPPFLYVDFETEAEDLSENGNNGLIDGLVSFDVEGAPQGSTPTTAANFTGGHIDFPDIDMNSMIRDFEDGSYTFSCWLNPIGSAGGQGFIWGQTQQGIHNGIRNGGVLHSAHWGADWNASTQLEPEQWVHAVWTYDAVTDTAAIYLNGELDGGPNAQRAPNGGGTFILGARNNGSEQYDGYLDDVAIWREVLSEGMIAALADGASPIGATSEDADGDGLPDSWEDKYGVDDPEGDDDNDGLTNIDEFEARTKPNKADSDEDGLNDKEEIEVTETNPLQADTDRDGLLDGVETNTGQFVSETNTGTDPNKKDTDDDGFNDDIEISQGSDPNNKNSVPQLGLSILFIGGQAEATQGADGEVMSFLEERYGPQNITYKQASQTVAGEEAEYAVLIISSTPGSGDMRNKFQDSTTAIVNWEEAIADNGGGEFQITAGRTKDNVAEDHVITILEDHPITAGFNVGQDVTISNGQTEVWWSTGQQAPGSISLASEKDDPSRLFLTFVDEGGELNNGSLAPGKRVMLGITDATFNNFTEDGKTLVGQSIDWALGVAGGLAPLNFTEIIYNAEDDTFRFKWNSRAGKTYSLFYSEDLSQFDADLDDSIESGGDFTTYPPEDQPGLENPLSGSNKLFFQVMENED